MKRAIFLSLLLCGMARGATYYVSTTGSNTSPYETWAKAALLPSTVITAGNTDVGGDGPHVVNIAAGTYTDNLLISDADWDGATITGADADTTVITKNNAIVLRINGPDNITIQNLTLQMGGSFRAFYKDDGGNNIVFDDCVFLNPSTSYVADLVSLQGDSTVFNRCRFYAPYISDAEEIIYETGDAATDLNYCRAGPPLGHSVCSEVQLGGSGTHNVRHCVFLGAAEAMVRVLVGTVNLYNSILAGGYGIDGTYRALTVVTGTCNVYNTHLLGNPWLQRWQTGTLATNSDNDFTSRYPRFTSHGRVGYIIPCVDDRDGLAYVQSLETVLNTYGAHGTWFLYQTGWNTDNDAAVRTLVANGTVEIACHSYSHSDMTYTHGLAVTYTGTDTNPTVALTAGRALQFRTTEGNDDFDLDTTAAAYDTIGELVAADAHNFGIAKSTTDGQSTDNLRDAMKATSLAALGATAVPCDVDLDLTGAAQGYFKDEIADPKTWIADTLVNGGGNVTDPQTGATYACRTFAAPYSNISVASRTACIDAGYIAARHRYSTPAQASQMSELWDVDLFRVDCIVATAQLQDADEADVRAQARSIAFAAVECGIAFPVLAHDATELTTTQWDWALDEWQKFGSSLKVVSLQEFADDIRAAPWTDDGDGTYSRTYTSYTDYHLLSGSPCIDAGIPLAGFDTDYDGQRQSLYGPRPEIGAYVYLPVQLGRPLDAPYSQRHHMRLRYQDR